MFIKAISYKGLWLAPGSEAYSLFIEKKFKELDKLIKEVSQRKEGLEK